MKYDYLVVGAGLFGSVFAYHATKLGKRCLVIDRKKHIGGNCYSYKCNGIEVHKYGAHIFRTSNEYVWNFINKFSSFNNFVNSPVGIYRNQVFNLPFNMNTFSKVWGIKTPDEAYRKIEQQKGEWVNKVPNNLEEKAISLIGRDLFEIFIKGYTEKQWGKSCKELPPSIIRRLPVRFIYDNNYFNDRYQGIPVEGYSIIFERMLKGSEVRLGVDFLLEKEKYSSIAKKIIYTGPIDEYYNYCFGELEYRSLYFENKLIENCSNYQGVAVVNYLDKDVPYTRSIEHRHFVSTDSNDTLITYEYPADYINGKSEPYYPINDYKNEELYRRYKDKSISESNIIFCGRLGGYKYTDMQDTILNALELSVKEFGLAATLS